MSDTKILQSILDGQVTIRKDIKKVDRKVDKVEKNLTTRMDALGKQLNVLDEDAPTRDEFDGLEERVVHLEKAPSN